MSGIVERFDIDVTPKKDTSPELDPSTENSSAATNPSNSQDISTSSEEREEPDESSSTVAKSVGGKAAVGVSTFAIAYAIHKFTAPVRIGFTITTAPIIVRFLRAKGILKHPVNKKL